MTNAILRGMLDKGKMLGVFILSAGCCGVVTERPYDVVVYGSSPAALTAAISAQRLGKSVVVISPETRIGGLTTGGLGQTDIGNKAAFGGLALQFYRDVAAYYKDDANWTRQKRSDYLPDGQCSGTKGTDSMWTFEPHAALDILGRWERDNGIDIRRGEFLDREKGGVLMEGGRIVAIRTLSGNAYRGKMFVDATYEGDLMAAAGVSYAVGREANAVYGETLNGIQTAQAKYHQFVEGISPYVKPEDPSSGLLPNVEPYDPGNKDGQGDRRVQAYCFRMCLTDVPENRIPFAKPANYDERNYELLLRNFEAMGRQKEVKFPWANEGLPWINSKMPNCKTDTNNRTGFSLDFIGRNWAWPEASYEERERMRKEHLDYQRGLMWTLANHPRIPETMRREFSRWGTCKDEFQDGLGDGWQKQLYVREARRLVGDYVMTEANCIKKRIAPRPVAMAAYTMDSHNVRRLVGADGFVHNEGDVQVEGGKGPFGIDYGALVPKRGECENLFVPVCLSASHIAFGSIRMEPVFFALGQVAGTAAAQAISAGCAVQDLPYGPLRTRLLEDGQVLGYEDRALAEEVRVRAGIGNFVEKLESGRSVTVAYLGGSITEMSGWRNMTTDWMRKTWPKAKVTEVPAAIGGTGSGLGVFRLEHDALAKNPDLLFVEFATNDANAPAESIWRNFDGIVQQTWTKNPKTDIVFVYTITSPMMKDYGIGKMNPAASAMEKLADHYGIPSVCFGPRVAAEVKAGRLVMSIGEVATAVPKETPDRDSLINEELKKGGKLLFAKDGVHPALPGHMFYLQSIVAAFERMRFQPSADHARFVGEAFFDGQLAAAKMVQISSSMLKGEGWTKLAPDSQEQRCFGGRGGQFYRADRPGAKLAFRFRGSRCAIYDLLAPNGANVRVTVDGKVVSMACPRFDSYCWYTRLAMMPVFAGEDGEHEVELEVLEKQPDRTQVKNEDTNTPKYNGTCFQPCQIMLVGELL